MGDEKGGTLIVLGAAVWPGGRASPSLTRRVERGAALWHRRPEALLVISGGVGRHPPSEASVGAAIARAAGVPGAAIVQEDSATSTVENLACTRDLFPDGLPRPVYLVSDWYHLPRAGLVAWILGLRPRLVAVGPRRGARALSRQGYLALREAVAIGPSTLSALRKRRP